MILRPALLVLALAASSLVWAQAQDVPLRVARLSYVEGEVAFQGAAEPSPSALPDRPLVPGDRLTSGRDGRAEIAFGTALIRLDLNTGLSLAVLDAATIRVELAAGTASVHLNELLEDEAFEVVTSNATIAFREPGEYRVDVAADGATEFTVRAGAADVATAGGPVRVAEGQRVRLEGRDPVASLVSPQPADAFDDWVLEREVQFAQSEPPPGEQSDGYEDETLSRYGEWYEEPSYGRVWMPSYAYGGYDPFRHGHWQRVGFGWSWYDPMPWSAHTLHYGRWAYLRHQNRWCWVPARRDHRRRDARDTRPYRLPQEDQRQADDRRNHPRDTNPRRDVDERVPVAEAPRTPIRIEGDRVPTYRGDAGTGKTPTRAAPAPRPTAPTSAGDAPTTMRPTRSVEARSPTESRPTSVVKGSVRTVEP